jgi:hypothetical protein
MRLAYKHMSWKYRLFKLLVLTLALVLPLKIFYIGRAYYSRVNLRRIRKFTGEPIPSAPVRCYEGRDDAKQAKA